MTATVLPSPASSTTRQRFRPWDRALIFGIPAVWAVVLLFHPTGDEFYPVVRDHHTAWMFVHLTMVGLIPLMALAVHRLIRGVDNGAARLSRIALPLFAVVYGVFEAVLGIGLGVLVSSLDTVTAAQAAEVVDAFASSPAIRGIEYAASLACGAAFIAAAFALRRANAVGWTSVALLVVATPLIAMHAPRLGPVGLVLFIIAVRPVVANPS